MWLSYKSHAFNLKMYAKQVPFSSLLFQRKEDCCFNNSLIFNCCGANVTVKKNPTYMLWALDEVWVSAQSCNKVEASLLRLA